MQTYKVILDSLFLSGSKEGRINAFSTHVVVADGARDAVQAAMASLRRRLRDNGIGVVRSGFFRTLHIVLDIWEIDDSAGQLGRDLGFTFYSTGIASETLRRLQVSILAIRKPLRVIVE